MVRIRAILYAVKYGLLPYWCYEKERHYECSYMQHLLINLKYAWRWLTFNEYESDIKFEKEVNKNYAPEEITTLSKSYRNSDNSG